MEDHIIELTEQEYKELERAMQWPEDLEQYDKLNAVTNLREIGF